jgi:hypothetical protein
MSQQIQASTPSPVSPAVATPVAAPSPEAQGSTAYPQWVAQAATPAVASATTQQAPSQVTPHTDPGISSQFNQYPSSPSPSNPWEQAMGSLERMVSRMAPSPSPVQQSPYSQELQAATTQNNLNSQAQPWAYQASTEAPTLPSNVSTTPNSFPASTASSEQLGLSDVTRQVVEHFGAEAPGILNQYSITLEDALISQNERMEQMAAQGKAMEHILTDPDQLADYTNRFFTEVYPVDAEEPVAQAAPQQQYRQDYNMPAPPAAGAGAGVNVDPRAQWEGFAQQMDQSPENAWRYLSQMGPEAIRSKLLFMDNR